MTDKKQRMALIAGSMGSAIAKVLSEQPPLAHAGKFASGGVIEPGREVPKLMLPDIEHIVPKDHPRHSDMYATIEHKAGTKVTVTVKNPEVGNELVERMREELSRATEKAMLKAAVGMTSNASAPETLALDGLQEMVDRVSALPAPPVVGVSVQVPQEKVFKADFEGIEYAALHPDALKKLARKPSFSEPKPLFGMEIIDLDDPEQDSADAKRLRSLVAVILEYDL